MVAVNMDPNQSHIVFEVDVPGLDQSVAGVYLSSANSTEEPNADLDCKDVTFIIYVPIFGTICLFGMVGNTLSFVVLQWEKRNKVATFLLQALAMSDNLFLLTTGFVQMFSAMTLYYGWDRVSDAAFPYIQVYIWPLVAVTQFGTVWMTVLIAANRYIAICRPFQAHKLCSMTKVRIQVVSVAILAVIYNIPKFFEHKLHDDWNPKDNSSTVVGVPTAMKTYEYSIIYESVMYCIFVFLGPLLIMVILNVCLVRELVAAQQRLRKRQIPIAGEEEENNITLVMVIIMAIFIITQAPAFINILYGILNPDAYLCKNPYYYYYHISNILVCVNSSTNFVVYCLFRQQFRERMRNFCDRYKQRFLLKHTDSIQQNGNTISLYSNTNVGDAL